MIQFMLTLMAGVIGIFTGVAAENHHNFWAAAGALTIVCLGIPALVIEGRQINGEA